MCVHIYDSVVSGKVADQYTKYTHFYELFRILFGKKFEVFPFLTHDFQEKSGISVEYNAYLAEYC